MKKMTKYLRMKITLLFVFTVFHATLGYSQTYQKLFDFDVTNGKYPISGLISDGIYLYGMTVDGGANNDGVIFRIKTDGTDFQKLFDFDDINGIEPYGSLVGDGTYLYGMTYKGGTSDFGVVFKIKPDGTDFQKLLDFNGSNGGSAASNSFVIDNSYLYGMTAGGGANNGGIIFKIKTDGTDFTNLFDFSNTTGGSPKGGLLNDGTYLYGITSQGGANDKGGVFKIKADGTNFTKLYDFNNTSNMGTNSSLISDGTYLYGTSVQGGANGVGNLFKIKPDGTDYTNLLDYSNSTILFGSTLYSDGIYLYSTALVGANNNGLIFRIKPDGTDYTELFNFNDTNEDGDTPAVGPLISDGTYLYGMTKQGGNNNAGVIFKLEIDNTTGIEQFENKNTQIKIFPNPANSFLNIESQEKTNIQIVNILDKIVSTQKLNKGNNNIDISNLKSGFYFLQTDKGKTVKFVKK